jgi:hypothetical protein
MGCGSSYPKKEDAVPPAVPPASPFHPSTVDQETTVAKIPPPLPALKVTSDDIEKAMKYEMVENGFSPRSSIRSLRRSSGSTPQGSPNAAKRGIDKFDDGWESKAESIEKKVEEAGEYLTLSSDDHLHNTTTLFHSKKHLTMKKILFITEFS